ncbi:MAG: M14 metallopeptidase family protein [Myxococcota bacterium]
MAVSGFTGWVSKRVVRRGRLAAALLGFAAAVGLLSRAATISPPAPTIDRDPGVRTAVVVTPRTELQRRRALAAADDLWSESPLAPALTLVVDARGMDALHLAGLHPQTVVPDIDAVAAAERARIDAASVKKPGDFFAEYKRFATVDAYLDTLVAAAPDVASVEEIGRSLEGRPIRAIRISRAHPDAPAFVINGGQHAREWISVMTTTCIADRLVRGAARDRATAALLERMQVYIVPVANPDGYAYSWDSDRYWRKNRRDGHGVDLNRNYPLAFGRKGSSDQPASPIYHGEAPFSEPESRALRGLLRRVPLDLHIDFHSFSQLVLYPWSHTADAAPDKKSLGKYATTMAEAIAATHGKKYEVIEGAQLYPASGTLMDWVYGERDAPSFVVELRPRRGDGFVLPPEQIVPTCQESLAAVLALAEAR